MQGADPIVSTGEPRDYKNLVAKTIGRREAENLLAVYYIPGMGHGGNAVRQPDSEQIDALEAMIDYQQSNGSRGAPAPAFIGTTRASRHGSGNSLGFYDLPHHGDDDDHDD